jgi:hypothetical protein
MTDNVVPINEAVALCKPEALWKMALELMEERDAGSVVIILGGELLSHEATLSNLSPAETDWLLHEAMLLNHGIGA